MEGPTFKDAIKFVALFILGIVIGTGLLTLIAMGLQRLDGGC